MPRDLSIDLVNIQIQAIVRQLMDIAQRSSKDQYIEFYRAIAAYDEARDRTIEYLYAELIDKKMLEVTRAVYRGGI